MQHAKKIILVDINKNILDILRDPEPGDFVRIEQGQSVIYKQFYPDFVENIDDVKKEKISVIKLEAGNRISSIDWKVTKVLELKALGKSNQADYEAVLNERDLIRSKSDSAELEVLSLETIDDINNFNW